MPALSPTACANRRQRLLKLLAQERLDAAVITDTRDIYYFTGLLLPIDLPAVLVVDADDDLFLIGPAEHDAGHLDHHLTYDWNYRGTRHPDPLGQLISKFTATWQPSRRQRIGVQRSSLLDNVGQILEHSSARPFLALD